MSDHPSSSSHTLGPCNGGASPSLPGSSSGSLPVPAPPSYDARNSSLAGALREPTEGTSSWSDKFRSLPTPNLQGLQSSAPEWKALLETVARLLNTSASKVTFHLRNNFSRQISQPLPAAAQDGEDFARKVVGPALAEAVYKIVLKQFYRDLATQFVKVLLDYCFPLALVRSHTGLNTVARPLYAALAIRLNSLYHKAVLPPVEIEHHNVVAEAAQSLLTETFKHAYAGDRSELPSPDTPLSGRTVLPVHEIGSQGWKAPYQGLVLLIACEVRASSCVEELGSEVFRSFVQQELSTLGMLAARNQTDELAPMPAIGEVMAGSAADAGCLLSLVAKTGTFALDVHHALSEWGLLSLRAQYYCAELEKIRAFWTDRPAQFLAAGAHYLQILQRTATRQGPGAEGAQTQQALRQHLYQIQGSAGTTAQARDFLDGRKEIEVLWSNDWRTWVDLGTLY